MDKQGRLFVEYCVINQLGYDDILKYYVECFQNADVATERNLVANAIKGVLKYD